ncbi:MAG: Ser-Thr-rich GPI-anchored membrane family protein [Bacteroidales bacterium]
MKKLIFSIIWLVVFNVISQLTLFSQSGDNNLENNLRVSYIDPVSLANEYINGEKWSFYWQPATKTMVNLLYNVGFSAARYGGRYIILESPSLAIDMVKGGAYVLSDMTYDGFLEIIKQAIKTPGKLCVNIAQSTKREGVKAYNIAYDIAQKQKETGIVTNEEAVLFLRSMWNSLKCAVARTLYIDSQEEYNIDELAAEKAVDEIIGQLEPAIRAKLDINNQLPLIDAAKFIHDIFEILENKKVGLAAYPPYIDYMKNISELNNLWLNTLERIGGNTIIESKDKYNYIIIPGKSVGPINYSTTLGDLISFYGRENVDTKTEYTAGEGTELETLTYIKNRGLTIRWKDQVTQDPIHPRFVSIKSYPSNYHTAEGITIGTSAQELGIINGGPFDYKDIEIEPFKMVTDWKGGKLEKYGSEVRNSWLIKLDNYSDMRTVELVIDINEDLKSTSSEKLDSQVGESLKIINPKGGESWQKGQKVLINWEANEAPGELHILLRSPDEYKLLMIFSVIKSGSTWVNIPYTIKNGSNWHLQFIVKNANGEALVQSERFSIGGDN